MTDMISSHPLPVRCQKLVHRWTLAWPRTPSAGTSSQGMSWPETTPLDRNGICDDRGLAFGLAEDSSSSHTDVARPCWGRMDLDAEPWLRPRCQMGNRKDRKKTGRGEFRWQTSAGHRCGPQAAIRRDKEMPSALPSSPERCSSSQQWKEPPSGQDPVFSPPAVILRSPRHPSRLGRARMLEYSSETSQSSNGIRKFISAAVQLP